MTPSTDGDRAPRKDGGRGGISTIIADGLMKGELLDLPSIIGLMDILVKSTDGVMAGVSKGDRFYRYIRVLSESIYATVWRKPNTRYIIFINN